jgi:uncharacterized membrane protein
MVAFIKWRVALAKQQNPARIDDAAYLKRLCRLNTLEIALVVLIPFVASCMARGIGFRL